MSVGVMASLYAWSAAFSQDRKGSSVTLKESLTAIIRRPFQSDRRALSVFYDDSLRHTYGLQAAFMLGWLIFQSGSVKIR